MALKITWHPKALYRFNQIVTYLENEFGEKTASLFIQKTYGAIFSISILPEIGSIEKKDLSIRGLVISKQVTLFYQIKGDKIILLNFFDNRRKPHDLKF
jgi:plasmid stabilization system protein ParE